MLLKIVSFIALIILAFTPSVAMPEKPDVLVETLDNLSENRTADEINGANGTKFYIQRPKSEKLTEVNSPLFRMHLITVHKIRRQNLLSTMVHIISKASMVLMLTTAQIC